MTSPAGLAPRDLTIDILRALALFPVVAVNWVGYANLPDGAVLGPPQPAGSWLAEGVAWLMFALIGGKGISLLAFLFGYSQALSAHRHGHDAPSHRRRRMGRLLVLGLLHGLFLYMGDILTTYAICGWVMLQWSGLKLRQLKRRLLVLIVLELAVTVGLGSLVSSASGSPAVPGPTLATPASWASWVALNASNFVLGQVGMILLGLPMPLVLMTAGLMAGRLRLFSHPRWRGLLQRWSGRWLWPMLLLNIAWTTLQWPGLREGDTAAVWRHFTFYLYPTVLLHLGLVPWLVLKAQAGAAWLRVLAPAGRHTLSLYLMSSVFSLLVFGGAGLAWQPGTAAVAGLALLYWLAWLMLAPRLGRRRLPPEAWLAR